jgi:hypothetical protein
VDTGLTFPFIRPFPWPSYSYPLYRFITHKPETCVLVLNCSGLCNGSGTVTSELTLFWTGTEPSLSNYLDSMICPLKRVLCGLDTFYFDTTAASVFVTGETTPKVFIPVVTVY